VPRLLEEQDPNRCLLVLLALTCSFHKTNEQQGGSYQPVCLGEEGRVIVSVILLIFILLIVDYIFINMSQRSADHNKSTRFFRHLSQHWLPTDVDYIAPPPSAPSNTSFASGTLDDDDASAIPVGPGVGAGGTSAGGGATTGGGGVTIISHHGSSKNSRKRSVRRRMFLLLTEPQTSIGSALFYAVLISFIIVSNLFEIMQTVDTWQFTPTDCIMCGGYVR
jgi:hypothetical protein